MLSHEISREARQLTLAWRGEASAAPCCCPIAGEQFTEVAWQPEGGPAEGEQPREAVHPGAPPSLEAQEDIDEESHPDLPFHGIGRVAEEVGQLKRLLDLFEEDLDLPATAVEVRYAPTAPPRLLVRKTRMRSWPSSSTRAVTRRNTPG